MTKTSDLEIINVMFTLEKGQDYHQFLRECSEMMPWLKYLYENCISWHTKSDYNVATMLYHTNFQFTLTGKKATIYRLQYRSC